MSCWDPQDKMESSEIAHCELECLSLSPLWSKDTCQGPLCCVQSTIIAAGCNLGHLVKWLFPKQLMNFMETGAGQVCGRLWRVCHFNLEALTSWPIWLWVHSSPTFRACQTFQKSDGADGERNITNNSERVVSGVRRPGSKSQLLHVLPARRFGTQLLNPLSLIYKTGMSKISISLLEGSKK